jgi:hypothetical protein
MITKWAVDSDWFAKCSCALLCFALLCFALRRVALLLLKIHKIGVDKTTK